MVSRLVPSFQRCILAGYFYNSKSATAIRQLSNNVLTTFPFRYGYAYFFKKRKEKKKEKKVEHFNVDRDVDGERRTTFQYLRVARQLLGTFKICVHLFYKLLHIRMKLNQQCRLSAETRNENRKMFFKR